MNNKKLQEIRDLKERLRTIDGILCNNIDGLENSMKIWEDVLNGKKQLEKKNGIIDNMKLRSLAYRYYHNRQIVDMAVDLYFELLNEFASENNSGSNNLENASDNSQ